MGIMLYVDDIRNPKAPGYTVVRSYEEAILFIEFNGIPPHISFDHDLGEASTKTGYDLAKWIIAFDMDYNQIREDFIFNVHSANPVGAKNIVNCLDHYLKYKFGEDRTYQQL